MPGNEFDTGMSLTGNEFDSGMNLTGMICAGMSLVGNEKVVGMSFLGLKKTWDEFSGMSLPGMNRRE